PESPEGTHRRHHQGQMGREMRDQLSRRNKLCSSPADPPDLTVEEGRFCRIDFKVGGSNSRRACWYLMAAIPDDYHKMLLRSVLRPPTFGPEDAEPRALEAYTVRRDSPEVTIAAQAVKSNSRWRMLARFNAVVSTPNKKRYTIERKPGEDMSIELFSSPEEYCILTLFTARESSLSENNTAISPHSLGHENNSALPQRRRVAVAPAHVPALTVEEPRPAHRPAVRKEPKSGRLCCHILRSPIIIPEL
ncbi:myopalladin-like isoform X1, partial [Lates japonicus]